MDKLKTVKDFLSRKYSFKDKNYSNSNLYFTILVLIGSLVAIFYYFYLKHYGGLINFAHYYEYYTKAVVITDYLKVLDFSAAASHYLDSYVDKILIFRSVPFFLLFGSSQFVFVYSNVFFNLFLLLILFHSLLKIMHPDKAFYFTLIILSQHFFLELLASFYVDLSYFLVCSIFFIYLSLFDKQPNRYNIRLIFLVFLLFLTKNVTYVLVPVLGVLFVIYFLLTKDRGFIYALRFLSILGVGFLFYYTFVLGFDYRIFISDIHGGTGAFVPMEPHGLAQIINRVIDYICIKGLSQNFYLLKKFPFTWLNLLIYPVVIFVYYKKRNLFWLILFLISDVFFFFLYNIKGHYHEYRYFLLFYLVYFYFIYEFVIIVFNNSLKINYFNKFLIIIIALFFSTGLFRLMDSVEKRKICYFQNSHFPSFLSNLPLKATVYIYNDEQLKLFYNCFIEYFEGDYSHLAAIDSRFKYKIVDSIEEAGYIVCKDCLYLDIKEYELIAHTNGYHLYKIK